MFFDSLDIANRSCTLLGVNQILSPTEDTVQCTELTNAYDKLRRAELRRNVWRFSVRKAALRAIDTTTLLLSPSLYNSSTTYLPGEIVQDANGTLWLSEVAGNLNNSPGGNNAAWDMYFGPLTVDAWASTTTYYAGELVYVITGVRPNGYQIYMSLISANSDVPGTATAWSALTQYNQDQVVSHSGSLWRSLLPINLNNTPVTGPLAWAVGTTYTSGQQVTGSDNYVYTSAVNSNLGNDPTTDSGSNWTSTGTITAWAVAPSTVNASVNWRPITASLRNIVLVYPLGSGPLSQSGTRNIYRLPAGWLREAPQNPTQHEIGALGAPTGIPSHDWEYDSNYIVTTCSGTIPYRFAADVTRVSAMDDMFCEGLACRMAAATCQRITQSDAKLQTIASEYQRFMGEARLINGIEQGPIDQPDEEFISARS